MVMYMPRHFREIRRAASCAPMHEHRLANGMVRLAADLSARHEASKP